MQHAKGGLGDCAFPALLPEEMGVREGYFDAGMSLRQYAAISLRIPESGDNDIDAMICKSNRQHYAGLAMQGLMPKYIKDRHEGYDEEYFTRDCLRIADALIARLEEDK